jgi:hypothetical protein
VFWQGQAQGGRGRGGGGPRRQAPRPLPYDRKKFLQANFRFLVGDAGNLRSCEKDPDLAPDWEDVVEVTLQHAFCHWKPSRASGTVSEDFDMPRCKTAMDAADMHDQNYTHHSNFTAPGAPRTSSAED